MKTELPPPHVQLAVMSREYVVSRAIHAVANLGVADHMSEEPMHIDQLAHYTGTIPELLGRVLTFLGNYGLFIKQGDNYALTPLSAPLKSDHPYSMKDVFGMVDESWWNAFAHLENELKTGIPAFKQQHGKDFFAFKRDNPEVKNRFDKGMGKLSNLDDQAIVQGFNFTSFTSLVDMGNGSELLSKTILKDYPHLSIDYFNIYEAAKNPSFELPLADAYLFKGSLHDFDDQDVRKILKCCYEQMDKGTSLIIAEQVIPEHDAPHTNKTMDIIMMVLVGGKQRTLGEWCKLVESVGFKLKGSHTTQGIFTVMEFCR